MFYSIRRKPRNRPISFAFQLALPPFPNEQLSESRKGIANREVIARLRKQSVPNSCRPHKIVFESILAALASITCFGANFVYLFNF